MLHHVVFFKLKHRDRPEDAELIRDAFEAMRGEIPELLHLEVGIDVLHSERSWDVALVARFADLAAMERYQVHPAHKRATALIKDLREQSIVVDWES